MFICRYQCCLETDWHKRSHYFLSSARGNLNMLGGLDLLKKKGKGEERENGIFKP